MSDAPPALPPLDLPDAEPAAATASEFIPTGDPLWLMIDEEHTPAREHELESLFSVSNGYLGSRGSLPLGHSRAGPSIFLAGVFDTHPPSSLPELAAIPGWTLLSQGIGAHRLDMENPVVTAHRRMLDMRQGMFRREFRLTDEEGRSTRIRFLRIASLADRHVLLQSVLLTPENYSGPAAIRTGFAHIEDLSRCVVKSRMTHSGPVLILERQTHRGVLVALAAATRFAFAGGGDLEQPAITRTMGETDDLVETEVEAGKTYRSDWLEVCYTSRDVQRPADAAVAHLERLLQDGVRPAILRHVDAWKRRWQACDVELEGDENAQRAVRFACYHLTAAANPGDERVSVGAKALTGLTYKGHVFWDTDIFVLPFHAFTDPPAARALLMYRFHTLAAARDKARKHGCKGALFAWESADTGEEVTPPYAIAPTGEVIPVVTGSQAHHISADVAYAIWQYWQATADDGFLRDAGAEMLVETARFWASRARLEDDGKYHIRKVIGPDEYHEGVDDNAYTNWMAQWNLECAAAAVRLFGQRWPQQWPGFVQRLGLDEAEPEHWLAVARAMFLGVDERRRVIEQFAGFSQLEEIDIEQFAPRSLPIDLILGRARSQRTKIIKQADVVMLLHVLWDRIPPDIRTASFHEYEPDTEHGSSLSPAIHALVAARLGDVDMAMRYFRQACEIDLADNMGNASGGVHIASLGGIWQTIAFGFAGLALAEDGLVFTPHCPPAWKSIRFALFWHGQRLQVRLASAIFEVMLAEGTALTVTVAQGDAIRLEAGQSSRWELHDDSWKEVTHERM